MPDPPDTSKFNWDGEDLRWLYRTADSAVYKALKDLHARLAKLEQAPQQNTATPKRKAARP